MLRGLFFSVSFGKKNNPATDPELKADNMIILDGAKVRFGNHVFVGPGCGFHTAQHPLNAERRNVGLEWAHPITVGDNVWSLFCHHGKPMVLVSLVDGDVPEARSGEVGA